MQKSGKLLKDKVNHKNEDVKTNTSEKSFYDESKNVTYQRKVKMSLRIDHIVEQPQISFGINQILRFCNVRHVRYTSVKFLADECWNASIVSACSLYQRKSSSKRVEKKIS